jgi:hypothetical protein
MLDRLLGTTKEQREAIKRLKEQIDQLEADLIVRRREYSEAIEGYKQLAADKWEYFQCSDAQLDQYGGLNGLGAAGWELAAMATYEQRSETRTDIHLFYAFKRRIPSAPAQTLDAFKDIPVIEAEIRALQAEVERIKESS